MSKPTREDWQAAGLVLQAMAGDETFVRLVTALRENPTHANHPWTEPDDFEIAVQDCKRCEAFFSLPFTVVENMRGLTERGRFTK